MVIKDTKEYIYEGTSKKWIELGDEGSHLTKATADNYYIPYTGATEHINLGDHSIKTENNMGNVFASLDYGGLELTNLITSRIITRYCNSYITITNNNAQREIYLPFTDAPKNADVIALTGDIPEIAAITETEINNLFK